MKARFGPNHPGTLRTLISVADADLATRRTPEAIVLLEEYSAANPQDLLVSLKVAALRAWFGQRAEFSASRRRALALVDGTDDLTRAELAAKLSSLLPSSDKAELDAALALGRLAAKPGDEKPDRPNRLLALGMAAFRAGDDRSCDEALRTATGAGKGIPGVTGTTAFYRAMSLHRRGRVADARKLATEAATTMTPLPKNEKNPLVGNVNPDHLILWLAYKEAKALIGFAAPPAAPAKPDGK